MINADVKVAPLTLKAPPPMSYPFIHRGTHNGTNVYLRCSDTIVVRLISNSGCEHGVAINGACGALAPTREGAQEAWTYRLKPNESVVLSNVD